MSNAKPSFWVTHLAKVLSGEQPCQRPLYLFARGAEKRPRENDGEMATWKATHSAQLQGIEDQARAKGWSVRKEVWTQVTGQYGVVKGKIDLVCQQTDKRPMIVDAKGGNPRDTDVTQVMIYQVLLPLAWKAPSMQFDGAVIYKDAPIVKTTPAQAEALKPKLFDLVKRLSVLEIAPEPNPSFQSCRFCDVTDQDCHLRWKDEDEGGSTEEF